MKPSCTTASPRRTSPSRESPPRRPRNRHSGQRPRSRAAPACRGPRHVTVCRSHPGRDDHGNQARGRPAAQPEALQARIADYASGQDAALSLISPVFADLSGLPPLIIQAGTHEVSSTTPPARATSRQRRRRSHARHHPWGAACLPGLSPDPRRSDRGARQSRTVPVGASRRCGTRHRRAKGRTHAGLMTESSLASCL